MILVQIAWTLNQRALFINTSSWGRGVHPNAKIGSDSTPAGRPLATEFRSRGWQGLWRKQRVIKPWWSPFGHCITSHLGSCEPKVLLLDTFWRTGDKLECRRQTLRRKYFTWQVPHLVIIISLRAFSYSYRQIQMAASSALLNQRCGPWKIILECMVWGCWGCLKKHAGPTGLPGIREMLGGH